VRSAVGCLSTNRRRPSFLLQNVNPRPNEILVDLRYDLANLERDARVQISQIKKDMEQRIAAVQKDFQSARSKLEGKIKKLEKEDHPVHQNSDELPSRRVGNGEEASAANRVDAQH
jgi:Skp family chaperone for outer membrane proteins